MKDEHLKTLRYHNQRWKWFNLGKKIAGPSTRIV